MRALVVAASRHGSTAGIATAIAEWLRGRGVVAVRAEPEEVSDLVGVDAVVLGSAVYAAHWLAPAKSLVERLGDELAERPVWLFSSGPVGDPPKPAEEPADAGAMVQAAHARGHHVFAGKLDKTTLGAGERAIVRVLRAPEGDFRDWPEVEAWADEIADALGAGTGAGGPAT
ncbi:MAG TPA: flavodoxin domain-containing protein [Acidimicrobiales bacterium]|nr:flavodoxin domain-containing protein [Acidimicrobiales bacterium]